MEKWELTAEIVGETLLEPEEVLKKTYEWIEAQVEKGKIIVCSADLQSNINERPVAKQLLYSLTKYMISDQFKPKFKIEYSTIEELFEKKKRAGINFYTKQSTDNLKPKVK